MLDQKSVEYFRRRELAERAATETARTEAARLAHQELADGYAALLRDGATGQI